MAGPAYTVIGMALSSYYVMGADLRATVASEWYTRRRADQRNTPAGPAAGGGGTLILWASRSGVVLPPYGLANRSFIPQVMLDIVLQCSGRHRLATEPAQPGGRPGTEVGLPPGRFALGIIGRPWWLSPRACRSSVSPLLGILEMVLHIQFAYCVLIVSSATLDRRVL